MKPSSAKAKGRKQQQAVRDQILATFPTLKPADVESTSMGVTGMDLKLSTAARELFPFAVESRRQEKLNVWEAIADAKKHGKQEGLHWLAVIGRNHEGPYAVVDLGLFMEMAYRAYCWNHPGYNGT